ncbi:MAG: hypothetical protein F9K27_14570 [Anaerolineae bacterium]|nr:MAG: hypothetical protein F9K27_14570 [Anaerolineae bacterium]
MTGGYVGGLMGGFLRGTIAAVTTAFSYIGLCGDDAQKAAKERGLLPIEYFTQEFAFGFAVGAAVGAAMGFVGLPGYAEAVLDGIFLGKDLFSAIQRQQFNLCDAAAVLLDVGMGAYGAYKNGGLFDGSLGGKSSATGDGGAGGPSTPDLPDTNGDLSNNTHSGDKGDNRTGSDGDDGTTDKEGNYRDDDSENRRDETEEKDAPRTGLCRSFSADTEVATEDGLVPIGELEPGDKVLAYDQNTGATGEYEITAVGEHLDDVVLLTIDGEVIETTADHPFYTEENGWTEVDDLKDGYHIRRADGSYGVVEAVSATILSQPMFNLTVDTAHTFFVGEGQWLVHNEICSWPSGNPPSPEGRKLAEIASDALKHSSFKPATTVAVVEVDGKIYIAVNGGTSSTIRSSIETYANAKNYSYLENDLKGASDIIPNNHAEMFLYNYKDFKGKIDVIGVSHYQGPCPTCQGFFNGKNVEITYDNTFNP